MNRIIDPLTPSDELIVANYIGNSSDGSDLGAEFRAIGEALVDDMRGYIKPDYAVLDVGCGLGRTTRALTRVLSEQGMYVGIDVSRGSIAWCVEKYQELSNFSFIFADIESSTYNPQGQLTAETYRFPFEDSRFYLIYSTSLFTHMLLAPIGNYVGEMSRVLKPGGVAWNTYVLLDDFAETSAKAPEPKESVLTAAVPVEGGYVAVAEDPARLAAFRIERIMQLHIDHHLEVIETRLGWWSGRPPRGGTKTATNFQDAIIARKPLALPS